MIILHILSTNLSVYIFGSKDTAKENRKNTFLVKLYIFKFLTLILIFIDIAVIVIHKIQLWDRQTSEP